MEEKVMTIEELINYADTAREEFEEGENSKREQNLRYITKMIIDTAKKSAAVMITQTAGGELYLADTPLKEVKGISCKKLKTFIDSIPALYAEIDDEESILFVTFRRSDADSEK